MKPSAVLGMVLLLCATSVRADERLASEDFSSADTLRFGPDNVTSDAIRSRALTRFPFNRVLELPSGGAVRSEAIRLGPTARGRIEDVVWLRLSEAAEEGPGRRAALTVVAFEGGGPEVRILRTTTRPAATVEWFDGAVWQRSGAAIALNRQYRLRTVIDLDLGSMDIYVREESPRGGLDGKEWALARGRTFRAFSEKLVRRKFALGRPSAMKAGLAAWQLWRVGQNELIPQAAETSDAAGPAAAVMRYAAPAVLTGDALRTETGAGAATYTLAPARGMRDDFELPDVSRWSPPARVQRQNRFRFDGNWSLGLSEGNRPVDTDLALPRGDFELRVRFLVPRQLPANRQIYLVRFKNLSTGAEPVGPGIYLDYGAAGDGKSLVICQLRPDTYYAQEIALTPGAWHGLRLVTQRARSAYLAWFINPDGTEIPLNQGKLLSFFLGTSMEDHVQWRFFSIVSMRADVSGWPKIELKSHERRLPVVYDTKQLRNLKGLSLHGLTAEKARNVDLRDRSKTYNALRSSGEIISKTWPTLRLTADDVAGLKKRYVAFMIRGYMYTPWSGTRYAGNVDGTLWFWMGGQVFKPLGTHAAGAFTPLELPDGAAPVRGGVALSTLMVYVPADANNARAEVRWIHPPAEKPERYVSIAPELFTGKKVVLTHPGAPLPMSGAAVVDGTVYIARPRIGLAVYDRNWMRTRYNGRFFEKATGSRNYPVSAFTWDAWAECFWVFSATPHWVCKLDRNLKPVSPRTRLYYVLPVAAAAGADAVYFVTTEGGVVRCDKFFATRRSLPMDKMFGGKPLVSALTCVDRFLYLAMRADSPISPSQIICVDTKDWNPVFSVELKDRFPDVTAMATEDETMYLFSARRADVLTFRLPPRSELEPQKTFVYLDDVALKPVKAAQDVTLIPDPSGGVAGWTPPGALRRNKTDAWYLPRGVHQASYDKAHIAYIGKGEPRYGWLKLRTQEPQRDAYLYVNLHTSESRVTRRVIIHYRSPIRLMQEKPELFGKTFTLDQFFGSRELRPLWSLYAGWSRYLDGPIRDLDLTAVRILPTKKGFTEHVFSLEKHFGIKEGETISGITLSHYRYKAGVPIVSLSLSASEWIPREDASGTVTSRVMPVDASRRRLEFLSWEQIPYDADAGRMQLYVRTAVDKHFIDREPWKPVKNNAPLDMDLGGYLQWRLEMSTTDPWRAPGVSNLLFGFGACEVAEAPPQTDGRGWWLLLLVPAAGLIAWLLVGRRALWERRRKT